MTRIAQEPYCHITDEPPHEEDEIMSGHKRAYDAVTGVFFRRAGATKPIELLAEIELKSQLTHDNKHFMYFVLNIYGVRDGNDIIIDRIETTKGSDISDTVLPDEMERIRQYIRENC